MKCNDRKIVKEVYNLYKDYIEFADPYRDQMEKGENMELINKIFPQKIREMEFDFYNKTGYNIGVLFENYNCFCYDVYSIKGNREDYIFYSEGGGIVLDGSFYIFSTRLDQDYCSHISLKPIIPN